MTVISPALYYQQYYINGLAQERINSIADALQLLQSYNEPSICGLELSNRSLGM